MSMINTKDILETIKMIEEEHLDIRTITMGISRATLRRTTSMCWQTRYTTR